MGLNIILQRVRCVAQRHASVLHRSQHNFLRFHGALAKRKHDRNPAIRIWNACPMLDIHAISSLLVVSMKQVARPYLLGIPPPFAAPSHLPAQPPEQRPVLPWHGPRSVGSACFLFHMPWSLERLRRLTVRGNIDYIHYLLSLLPPTSTRATVSTPAFANRVGLRWLGATTGAQVPDPWRGFKPCDGWVLKGSQHKSGSRNDGSWIVVVSFI